VNARERRAYTDHNAPLGLPLRYQVTPIDVFGRSGEPRDFNVVTLAHPVPVPPKHVRARVDQPGAALLLPGPAAHGAVALETSAEFGEAQRRASPHAADLEWRWRSGPLEPEVLGRPDDWHVLGSVSIGAAAPAALDWSDAPPPEEFTVRVAQVRAVTGDAAGPTRRLDEALPDVSNRVAPAAGHMELLLDCALLQPGIFSGFTLRHGTEAWPVLSSTAGIAAADDRHSDERMTARVVLPETATATTIEAGSSVTLRQPDLATLSLAQVRTMLRSGGGTPFAAAPLVRLRVPAEGVVSGGHRAAGGEVAVHFPHIVVTLPGEDGFDVIPVDRDHPGRRTAVVTGRVVAQVAAADGAIDTLLRVRGETRCGSSWPTVSADRGSPRCATTRRTSCPACRSA
jgi:hypothetical protein